jgi:hypothetical protein
MVFGAGWVSGKGIYWLFIIWLIELITSPNKIMENVKEK